jgi:hypothetical protein
MNDIDYILIHESEVKELVNKHSLKLWWVGAECHKVILNNKEVALIETELMQVGDKELLEILTFEVFEKDKGTGSIIVEDIKKEYDNIHVNPHDIDSELFWEKHDFIEYGDGWYYGV